VSLASGYTKLLDQACAAARAAMAEEHERGWEDILYDELDVSIVIHYNGRDVLVVVTLRNDERTPEAIQLWTDACQKRTLRHFHEQGGVVSTTLSFIPR
jgi:hypothetical protein